MASWSRNGGGRWRPGAGQPNREEHRKAEPNAGTNSLEEGSSLRRDFPPARRIRPIDSAPRDSDNVPRSRTSGRPEITLDWASRWTHVVLVNRRCPCRMAMCGWQDATPFSVRNRPSRPAMTMEGRRNKKETPGWPGKNDRKGASWIRE